ncbi:MAG: hypothetical protein R3Y53_11740, partial [Bacillota bacterium]
MRRSLGRLYCGNDVRRKLSRTGDHRSPLRGNGSVFYKMTGDHRSPLRGERFSFLQNDGRPQVAPTWNGSVFY